jgi:hypothetical protein
VKKGAALTERESVRASKDLLRALLDTITGSMDYSSGFLIDEQVDHLREAATLVGMDPRTVTPGEFACRFDDTPHEWSNQVWGNLGGENGWYCRRCRLTSRERPTTGEIVAEYDPPLYGRAISLPASTFRSTPDDGHVHDWSPDPNRPKTYYVCWRCGHQAAGGELGIKGPDPDRLKETSGEKARA